jgi:hypothetical protein
MFGRSAVASEVERFHGSLLSLNGELSLIVQLLALGVEGRERIPELCSSASVDIRVKAEALGEFREKYVRHDDKVDADAALLARACARLVSVEIDALALFAEALIVAGQVELSVDEHVELSNANSVENDDLCYLSSVLRTARTVYNSHVSFVHSALIYQGPDLVAFTEHYDTDSDTAASIEAFDRLKNTEFPRFRARIMEHTSD